MRSAPKPGTLNSKPARAAHRSLAATIVANQAADMSYIGWFIAIVQAYPDHPHDWRTALATASRLRMALHIAESLLRSARRASRAR